MKQIILKEAKEHKYKNSLEAAAEQWLNLLLINLRYKKEKAVLNQNKKSYGRSK